MEKTINKTGLPNGWKLVKLGSVCTVRNGYAFKSEDYRESGVLLFRQTNLYGNRVNLDNAVYLPEGFIKDYNSFLIQKGDVLIGMSGSVGKLCIYDLDAPALQNQRTGLLRFSDSVDRKFVHYFFQTLERSFIKMSKGVAVMNISAKDIHDSEFPLPPLQVQKKIVSKLDELFSELDKSIEQLKTAQEQLKVYRQSVLKWAFEGKLTARSNGILKDGWIWRKSGELFDHVTSGSRGWAKYYSDEGSIFIRITNLDFDTLDLDLEESKIQYVNPPSNSEGIRTSVKEGDFLFSITGYLGMFAIAPNLDKAYVNQHIALCRPKSGFNRKFVGYWIISRSGGNFFLNKMTKGATKAGLGLDDIKNFPVPLPPIEEQQMIVDKIEHRLTLATSIEENIKQSLLHAEIMKKSILKKAFDGHLH